jgi:long-chain acyl-CoA synthetase
LILRGEPMMTGYWNKPEATAEVMKNGWLHTGDMVTKDEKGYFHWKARLKDTIRRAGENISSVEVEGVLMEHPAVKVAAVVPVPDELRGEEVKAYIVLKEGIHRKKRRLNPFWIMRASSWHISKCRDLLSMPMICRARRRNESRSISW